MLVDIVKKKVITKYLNIVPSIKYKIYLYNVKSSYHNHLNKHQ